MLRRISATILAVALGTATLVVGPAAHAETAISEVTVSPSTVVVTSTAKIDVTFSFVVTDSGSATGVYGPKGGSTTAVALTAAPHGTATKYTGKVAFGRDKSAGDWVFTAKAGTVTKSADFKVVQVWETDIKGFGASPEPVKAGSTLNLGGRLVVNGPKGWRPYKDQKVWILFKDSRGDSYKRVAYDRTNWRGEFSIGVKASRSGWWKAEFEGVKDRSHGSLSDSDQVDVIKSQPPKPKPPVKHDTRFSSFNASPEPVKYKRYLSLRGTLKVEDKWDWDGYGDEKVAIWFRTKFGGWKYVKSTWTNDSGKFYTKTIARKSGYWKVTFAGDTHSEYASSRKDYVKVKR